MYETLTEFLINLSSGSPLIWASLVLLVIAGTGLVLHFFWEAVLKGIGALARFPWNVARKRGTKTG